MKGKIEGVESWSGDEICYYLDEAGLREVPDQLYMYRCGVEDAAEVVAVIEHCHDVTFSPTDCERLAKLMARGSIGEFEFMNWLMKCNKKPVRKAKTHAMPLFEGGAK